MDFEIIYPKIKRKSVFMSYFRYVCGIVFLAASLCCVVVNIAVGGSAWSVIVLWSLYMVWTLILKQPLVERNLIRQGVRLFVMAAILLVLIDFLIYPGWAKFVVPIFGFAALITLAILFFVNVSKQRHNIMPLIYVLVAALIGSALALFVFSDYSWPIIVLASVAASLLITTVFILRMRFISEIRKRFHIK